MVPLIYFIWKLSEPLARNCSICLARRLVLQRAFSTRAGPCLTHPFQLSFFVLWRQAILLQHVSALQACVYQLMSTLVGQTYTQICKVFSIQAKNCGNVTKVPP